MWVAPWKFFKFSGIKPISQTQKNIRHEHPPLMPQRVFLNEGTKTGNFHQWATEDQVRNGLCYGERTFLLWLDDQWMIIPQYIISWHEMNSISLQLPVTWWLGGRAVQSIGLIFINILSCHFSHSLLPFLGGVEDEWRGDGVEGVFGRSGCLVCQSWSRDHILASAWLWPLTIVYISVSDWGPPQLLFLLL